MSLVDEYGTPLYLVDDRGTPREPMRTTRYKNAHFNSKMFKRMRTSLRTHGYPVLSLETRFRQTNLSNNIV